MKRSLHIILAGESPLALKCATTLAARGLHVTAIRMLAPEQGSPVPEDLIVGDASDTEVLRSAGIEQARAVLALSDDDAYNAFIILAARELNPELRTVAAVRSDTNAGRVKRAHPDVVLSMSQIGSELLAMALSGEEIKAEALVSQLIKLA